MTKAAAKTTPKAKVTPKAEPAAPTVLMTPAEPADKVIEAEMVSVNQLTRLDQAQNLPEIECDVVGTDSPTQPVCAFQSAIEAFKDRDHRIMAIVVLDGTLYKQEI